MLIQYCSGRNPAEILGTKLYVYNTKENVFLSR